MDLKDKVKGGKKKNFLCIEKNSVIFDLCISWMVRFQLKGISAECVTTGLFFLKGLALVLFVKKTHIRNHILSITLSCFIHYFIVLSREFFSSNRKKWKLFNCLQMI